ncbi:MAG: serine hydrolase domain-containing protein [Flavobacteriales bacterium]
MKHLKRTFFIVLAVLFIIYGGLAITGNGHILEGVPQTYFRGLTKPDINDFELSDVRTIAKGKKSEPWSNSSWKGKKQLSPANDQLHEDLKSAAFLVIWKDSILHESYWDGYEVSTLSNSFSMAKSFTAMAVGKAQEEGLLSVDDKVSKYLERYSEGENNNLTIKHLLQMRSNLGFGEDYANPFGYQAKAYYNDDLFGITAPYRVEQSPGTTWQYQGGNTVILHEILEKVTGKTLADLFSESIYSKIGAEHDAYWGLDDPDGKEKAFSAVYATARDFARIGKLYLHHGKWNGNQVLDSAYVAESLESSKVPDKDGLPANHYGYQWWIDDSEIPKFYMCQGMRGQYIINVPEEELTIVRLGHERSEKRIGRFSEDVYQWIEMAKSLIH